MPIHALSLENMSKCVFLEDMLKSRCKFITLLEKYEQQKQLGWEVNFSELGFAGSGRIYPGGSSRALHTLVKENTPCQHKIRLECGFTQKAAFSLYYCVFFPTVMQILVGRLGSYLLTHTKKYMTPIAALIFEKHVKMCVYARHFINKKPV